MSQVTALYRYPVKGLSAEPMTRLELRAGEGVPLDREFALALADTEFDEAAPEPFAKTYFLTLMRHEKLASLSTRFEPATGILAILKDGRPLLEASVMEPAGRAAIADFFAAYMEVGRPRLVRAAGHKFTDVSVVSPTMMRAVSVINLASVRALEQALGRPLDPLRFRANIYFDGLPAWSELDWIDKEVSIGPARLRGMLRTRRCAATNVNPATAERDENLPAALMRHFGHPDMGIYLDILSSGSVNLNDQVGVPS
jgi:uncharacterized protein YcbX